MSEARSRRVFFALWPDDEATGHLAALAHSFAAEGGRAIRPVSLHLTLAFVGSVTPGQVEELERIAAGVRGTAFDLSLDRLGFWPRGGTLWAGCRQAPSPMRHLADGLATALRGAGFAIDPHTGAAQVPHVTLARHVRCASLPRLGDAHRLAGWASFPWSKATSIRPRRATRRSPAFRSTKRMTHANELESGDC
jgi:2'-5' RNA ligase